MGWIRMVTAVMEAGSLPKRPGDAALTRDMHDAHADAGGPAGGRGGDHVLAQQTGPQRP